MLAQRTAQLAVQEARHEAERIQSEARVRAETIVSGAEDAARRTVEETNERLREEVGKLEAARERLRADVDDLERYLDEQRQQLQSSLSEARWPRWTRSFRLPPGPAPEPAAVGAAGAVARAGGALRPSGSRPALGGRPRRAAPDVDPEAEPMVTAASVTGSPVAAPPLSVDDPGDPEPAEPLTVAGDDPERAAEAGSIWAAVPADAGRGRRGHERAPRGSTTKTTTRSSPSCAGPSPIRHPWGPATNYPGPSPEASTTATSGNFPASAGSAGSGADATAPTSA